MTRRLVAFLLLVATLAALPGAARAAALGRGTRELQPEIRLSHTTVSFDGQELGNVTSFTGTVLLGISLDRLVALHTGVVWEHESVEDEVFGGEASATAFGGLFGVTLNVATEGRAVPFVRGAVGLLVHGGDAGDEASLFVPLSAGVRFLIGNAASINLSAGWTHTTNANGFEDLSTSELGLGLGVSVYPGGIRDGGRRRFR